MQKIIYIIEDRLNKVNEELKDGWEVKMIVPYNQPVSKGEGHNSDYGTYGVYVVLEK